MKKYKVLLAIICVCAVFLAGCKTEPPLPTTVPTTAPATSAPTVPTTQPPDAREIYRQFIEQMPESITIDVSATYETEVAGFPFIALSQQKITYLDRNTEAFCAQVEESLAIGNYTAHYSEVFRDGTAYALIEEDRFRAEMTGDDFMARFLPVVLLDETLYETVTVDGDQITFADPTALESWLLEDEVVITEAGGTVTVSGGSIGAAYHATYQVGGSTLSVTVKQTFLPTVEAVDTVEDADTYLETESIDGIKLMDYAYGNLTQTKQFSSSILVTTQSQAAGIIANTQYRLDSYVTQGGTDYQVTTEVYAQDATDKLEQEMKERFIGGKYSVSVDDGEESYNTGVTAAVMKNYVLETLQANIWDNSYLTGASVTDLGSLYLVELTCSDELARSISQDFSGTYLGDPELLDNYASSYVTNKMEYYVSLDKYTLLPTACGYLYEGCHTIDGSDYLLIEQLDQSFDLASLSSHDAIYEEPAPDTEPEEKATPLFYKVTGPDGQLMWLFGTIHVGDDRTAFLPQEIYDALLSSDALAVECDTEGFDEDLEEDEKLQNQVSDFYFYSDGTIADHLDTEDLYEDAVKVMRATGSYFYNSDYMKASTWSSSIDNYYLSQGHQLLSEKGVESRLTKLAEDNDIPLWEVESSLFQLQMLTGYSDYLQEFQLYSSVYSHGKSSWEGVAELYELWCEGDEAKLTVEMKREPWAFTEEDLEETEDMDEEDLKDLQYIRDNLESINGELAKIYGEYIKSMESDRNAGMLEVAKGYLESGNTVFFAVGLAHLIAEDGLVFTLREAGYTVELVTYGPQK